MYEILFETLQKTKRAKAGIFRDKKIERCFESLNDEFREKIAKRKKLVTFENKLLQAISPYFFKI